MGGLVYSYIILACLMGARGGRKGGGGVTTVNVRQFFNSQPF